MIPTSNHNRNVAFFDNQIVVYLLIPTSNHNPRFILHAISELYIFWFLHQTTTVLCCCYPEFGCISFDSYIKPQHTELLVLLAALYIFWFLHQTTTRALYGRIVRRCISFDSYIKPQLRYILQVRFYVVYLLIPTSNHNPGNIILFANVLYIFWFLHQTTTKLILGKSNMRLYIFWFLHQTTTKYNYTQVSDLDFKPFEHTL